MMMTQHYYGGDFDSFHRPSHRAPTAAHYDRSVPYTHGYYEPPPPPHHELRSEYVGLSGSRTMIAEPSPEAGPHGHARRRIQVACSRCRRRKIKCTGDPGDGSGCSACRSAGADRNQCTFIRVGSKEMPMPGIDLMPANGGVPSATPASTPYGADVTAGAYDAGMYQTHHRPSLPMLQTRTAYPEYDSYNASPVDDYTYATSSIPRQQSFSSTYGAESFRPWTSASVSAPATTASMYYEPGSAFSFGTLQANGPFPTSSLSRLPSVTGEAFSPLNMGSLHSSLPTQTVQERRLPVPYTPSYPQQAPANGDLPQIRPLSSFSEPQRAHIGGIHSRSSMSWANENPSMPSVSRGGSVSSLSSAQYQQHGLPLSSSASSTSSISADSAVLGYQFSASNGSPEVSPTSGPSVAENYSSDSGSSAATPSMMPPSTTNNIRYSSSGSYHGLPALSSAADSPRPQSSHEAAASLYSFSTGVDNSASDRHSVHNSTEDGGQTHYTATPQQTYPPLRRPQPQHAASVDELRRRSSYDQRAATAHRMSVQNLNGRY